MHRSECVFVATLTDVLGFHAALRHLGALNAQRLPHPRCDSRCVQRREPLPHVVRGSGRAGGAVSSGCVVSDAGCDLGEGRAPWQLSWRRAFWQPVLLQAWQQPSWPRAWRQAWQRPSWRRALLRASWPQAWQRPWRGLHRGRRLAQALGQCVDAGVEHVQVARRRHAQLGQRGGHAVFKNVFQLVPLTCGARANVVGHARTRLVASEIFSSATAWVLRWMDRPSFTRASNTLPPSSWALEKRPDLPARFAGPSP
jgi:hypothetical protein